MSRIWAPKPGAPAVLARLAPRAPAGTSPGELFYLASDEARWVTGHTLVIDAGLTLTNTRRIAWRGPVRSGVGPAGDACGSVTRSPDRGSSSADGTRGSHSAGTHPPAGATPEPHRVVRLIASSYEHELDRLRCSLLARFPSFSRSVAGVGGRRGFSGRARWSGASAGGGVSGREGRGVHQRVDPVSRLAASRSCCWASGTTSRPSRARGELVRALIERDGAR